MPLPAKILQEEKTCLLMGDFNINLLDTDTDPDVSEFFNILSLNFFPHYLQGGPWPKKWCKIWNFSFSVVLG